VDKIEFGDCRETMRRWAEQGVKAQTCVTSPPYYGLRDYGHDGQIGLEETPEDYIKAMVEVFRCVWDVLADDGTLWLNIGDSYFGAGYSNNKNTGGTSREDGGKPKHITAGAGLKPKDLIGIPWMLAFALRADGWYLRQDIIWHKPNPMPESVQDRCTKAHEYIFLLTKSAKYYFNSVAIQEPLSDSYKNDKRHGSKSLEHVPQKDYKGQGVMVQTPTQLHDSMFTKPIAEGRNKRSVWTVTTKPYKGAHFATFPSDLITPCILAGAPAGGIVLDPFMGSGTTAAVAIANGRDYLGCELNLAYKELQDARIGAPKPTDLFGKPV
jgi:DNA modification methylase